MTILLVYLGTVLLMSLISFVAFGADKHWAVNGSRRVPERTLYLLAFLGGWPGAWLGQRYFRHKTKKLSFRVRFWLVVILHITIVAAGGYRMLGSSA